MSIPKTYLSVLALILSAFAGAASGQAVVDRIVATV